MSHYLNFQDAISPDSSIGSFKKELQTQLDAISRSASSICDSPIAFIALTRNDGTFAVSAFGADIAQINKVGIQDFKILKKTQSLSNISKPFVLNGQKIKSYAKVPFDLKDGTTGALAVMDSRERTFTEDQMECLKVMADSVNSKWKLHQRTKELEDGRVLLKNIIEAMPFAVTLMTKEEKIVCANKKASELLNESIVVEKHPANFNLHLPGEKRIYSTGKKLFFKALKGEASFSDDVKIHRGEEVIQVKMWCEPVFKNNEIVYVVSIFEEIGQQSNLTQSEESYKNLIEDIADVVYTTDPAGNFTYMNNRVTKLVEYKPEELLGKHFTTLIDPEWRDRVQKYYYDQFKEKKEETIMEFPVLTKSGKSRWVEQSVRIWWESESRIRNFHCMVRDIHIRKQTELAHIEAKQFAEEARKLQESFLANMSHEIRTPLNGIVGVANLLTQTSLSEKQKEYINAIQLSGSNLMVIINDILDLTKIHSGKMTFEKVLFNLRDTVQSATYPIRRVAEEKGIDFRVVFDNAVSEWVTGDPTRLSQILINLAGNAVKFTQKGFVTITVSNENLKGGKIKFRIEDSGIGISREKLLGIFEEFKQADADTTRRFGGTGLGLSISRQLIELQEGTITVESEIDKGSIFTFSLLLEAGTDPNKDAKPQLKRQEKSLKGLTILLAEDNMINQLVASETLSNWNAKVEVAENGKEVLSKLNDDQYDLILMDLQMPEMGGEECTRIIRESSTTSFSTIPIIAMTAAAFKKEKEKCIEIGMNGYVSKPFYPDDLYEEILNVLKVGAS